jgi:hypothetical protein
MKFHRNESFIGSGDVTMHTIYCKECQTELSFRNIKRLEDLDHTKIGMYCNDCFPAAEAKIKSLRYVETYKENDIYCKDGLYSPYWQSPYYFNCVEDTRIRIDNRHLGYYDPRFMGLKSL